MRYIVRFKSSSGDWKSLPTMGSDNMILVLVILGIGRENYIHIQGEH